MRHLASHTAPRRRRLTGAAVGTGLAGSLVLALSMGASLSGYTASITNSLNTAASNALAVTESSSGSTSCNSYDATATCTTINKYGGLTTPLTPGGAAQTTSVRFTNTGSIDVGTANLAANACVATSNGVTGSTTPPTDITSANNLCSVINIKIYKAATATGTPIFDGSATQLGSTTAFGAATPAYAMGPIVKTAAQDYTFVVSLPSGATTAVQGQKISQPLVWTFNQ